MPSIFQERIKIDPEVRLGQPVIRGTGIPVELVVRKLGEGASEADLLETYPLLTREDIRAALAYAADSLADETVRSVVERFETKQYGYGLIGVARSFAALFGIVGVLLALFAIAGDIQEMGGFLSIAGLVGLAALAFVFSLGQMVMFPAVRVVEAGMKVRVFGFWWVLVPWRDVVDLRYWPLGIRRMVVVVVEALTPFHLLYGMIYATKSKPAFFISFSISGYHDLVRTIESRTGKQLHS